MTPIVRTIDLARRLLKSDYWRQNAPAALLQFLLIGLVGSVQVWALAAFLPREQVGFWGYAAALVAMTSFFSLPGSSQALAYAAAHQKDGALLDTLKLRLRWGMAMAATLFVAAAIHQVKGLYQLSGLLVIAGVFAPIQMAFDSADAYLAGRGEFRVALVRKTISYGAVIASVATAAYMSRNVVICILVNYLTGTVVNAIFFRQAMKMTRNTERFAALNSMNVRFSGLSLVSLLSANIERPLLGVFAGFNQLAAYNVAKSFAMPVSIGRVFEKLLFSQLASRHGKSVRTDIAYGAMVLFALGWLAYGAAALILPHLVQLILPRYQDAVPIACVLLMQMPFNWAAKPIQSWLFADNSRHKRYWQLSWFYPASRLVLVTGGAVLHGVYGAAMAWTLAEALFFLFAVASLHSKSSKRDTLNEEHATEE